MNKEELKKLKEQQKKYAKLLKKAGVKKVDTPQQIDQKLLWYLQTIKSEKYSQIVLDDKHLSDPAFLLDVYSMVPGLIFWLRPKNEELTNSFNFMLNYLSLAYAHELSKQQGAFPVKKETHLVWLLENYPNLFKSPLFVNMLANQFPDLNIIYVIHECFENTYYEYDGSRKYDYRNLLAKLPDSLWVEQASKFGVDVLSIIPKTFDNFIEIVSSAIEKDGFDALAYLHHADIIKNKPLIKKAYIYGGGAQGLKKFLEETLSPYTEGVDYTHNPPLAYKTKNRHKYASQQLLMQDAEISDMLSK